MNAITAQSELAFENSARLSSVPAPAPAAQMGVLARVGAAIRWVIEMPRRRAVIEELMSLSDYELADIGLDRGDVSRLFSHPGSAPSRSAV